MFDIRSVCACSGEAPGPFLNIVIVHLRPFPQALALFSSPPISPHLFLKGGGVFDISRSPYKWYTTSFNTLCRVVLSVFFDTFNNIFYILIGEFEVFVNKKTILILFIFMKKYFAKCSPSQKRLHNFY